MSIWQELVAGHLTRRNFLRASALTAMPLALRCATSRPRSRLPFTPIPPTKADELVLAPGYRYDRVVSWGDDIGAGSGNSTFGIENDFIAYFPIDLLEKGFDVTRPQFGFNPAGASSDEGYLVVNNEAPHPKFGSRYVRGTKKTAGQIRIEQEIVGISVVRVARRNGKWEMVKDARMNRRYDGRAQLRLTGPAASLDGGPIAIGTFGNCSGGTTPWGTALSGEENVHDYPAPGAYDWPADPYAKRHYGYIVEVDPFDPAAMPRKHTAMGRFRHENAAVRVAADGTVAAYMGDDKRDSCVYKYVADRKLADVRDRAANMSILESGKLYVADFANGKWILLDRAADERLQKKYTSQAEVVADARGAGLAVGGTPVDRPEDLEIHPFDGSVFIACTNNSDHGNYHGQIVRLTDEPAGTTFDWQIFATGGPQSGFTCPDNMVFDAKGRLWLCSDVSDMSVGRGIYEFMGNNSVFYVSTEGADRGQVYRFASGPPGCETTGPCWTPDGKTLFLAIQHPGGDSPTLDQLTSHWPDGGDAIPRGSVVAITGF
jgi:secreted PhoX family phosphatase